MVWRRLRFFSDVIGVRLLLAGVVAAVAVVLLGVLAPPALVSVLGQVAPGLDVISTGLLLTVVAFGTVLVFTFMILAARQSSQFIPLRDYPYYVLDVTEL